MTSTNNRQPHAPQPGYDPNSRPFTGLSLSLNTTEAIAYQNGYQPLQHPPQHPPQHQPLHTPILSVTQSPPDTLSTAFAHQFAINGGCPALHSNGNSPSSLQPSTPGGAGLSPKVMTTSEAPSPAGSQLSYEQPVSPGPKKTGRPADWIPEKCRQLARAYMYTPIPIPRLIQIFSMEDQQQPLNKEDAGKKIAAAQKKLNQMLGRDNRPLRPKDYEQAIRRVNKRLNAAERTTSYMRRRRISGPHQRRDTILQNVERTLTNMSSKSVQLFKWTREMTITTIQGSWNPSPTRRPVFIPEPSPEPCDLNSLVLVPGNLLNLDTRNTDTRGYNPNERSISYRAVAAELSLFSEYLWVGRNEPTEMAKRSLQGIYNNAIDPSERDLFGHTILHFLAARPDQQDLLINIVGFPGFDPSFLIAKNTAGQTFLHTLSPKWFQLGQGTDCYFFQLIRKMKAVVPQLVAPLVSARDMYGRTVFHLILDTAESRDTALDITTVTIFDSGCAHSVALYRDTFGKLAVNPEVLQEPCVANVLELKFGYMPVRNYTVFPFSSTNTPLTPRERLIHVVSRANIDPFVEDEQGRGPLHCLAELSREDPDKKTSLNNVKRGKKRKASDAASPTSVASPQADDEAPRDPFYLNAEPVSTLIQKLGCSPSAYDNAGNTALMAFVDALPDREAKRLMPVLEVLIKAAQAEGLVDARNRAGETALMVAARGGKKTAFGMLLAAGANWHVRNMNGKGLLEVLMDNIARAKNDLDRFAPLEACCSMLTKDQRDEDIGPVDEVVMRPDVLDEWGVEARGNMVPAGGKIM